MWVGSSLAKIPQGWNKRSSLFGVFITEEEESFLTLQLCTTSSVF
jgi:hypothetical protein